MPVNHLKIGMLLLVLNLAACGGEEEEVLAPPPLPPYQECPPRSWSKAQIAEGLWGEWEWVYAACERGQRGRRYYQFELQPAGRMLLQQGGRSIATTWRIDSLYPGNDFIILSDSLQWRINGRVLLCDQVQLTFGFGPGICDNFFRRRADP